MAVRGHRDGVGIPVVLMHEGEGLIVTVETKTGYSYRGYMESAEDNMNASLKDVTATGPRGKVSHMERVFIRGSQIVFVVFPDLLGEAPMFRRVALAARGITVAGGLGRGRQAAIGARGASARVGGGGWRGGRARGERGDQAVRGARDAFEWRCELHAGRCCWSRASPPRARSRQLAQFRRRSRAAHASNLVLALCAVRRPTAATASPPRHVAQHSRGSLPCPSQSPSSVARARRRRARPVSLGSPPSAARR